MKLLPIIVALTLGVPSLRASAQTYPPRPAEGAFIYDGANMIDPSDETAIRGVASRLLAERGTSLAVATIPSMADLGARNWTIERYAHNLFDEWGLGSTEQNDGILLLVSKGDRKARIELGAAWSRAHDARVQQIMDGTLIPAFKRAEFSEGIAESVKDLDRMARSQSPVAPTTSAPAPTTSAAAPPSAAPAGVPMNRPIPPAPTSTSPIKPSKAPFVVGICGAIPILFIVVIAVVVISKISRGVSGGGMGGLGSALGNGLGGYGRRYGGWGGGWGGGGWGGGGGSFLSGMMVGSMMNRGNRGGGSSGGFSSRSFGGGGRSFGGGFSGRGGASGSW